MKKEIIHLAPFDIGCSFLECEYQKNNKEDFINKLSILCKNNAYQIIDTENSKYLFRVAISDTITCYLLECGIGVFVFNNLNLSDSVEIQKVFGDNNLACELYYQKKIEQNAILDQNQESVLVKEFMDDVWKSVGKKIRPYSSCKNYKHHGLSYVLSIYHIIDDTREFFGKENTFIDLLMNPSILSNICDKSQWGSIVNKIAKYKNRGYSLTEYTDSSNIVASWSAVAVIEEKGSSVIDNIVDYEISLQSSWFLFDCLTDNIKNSQMTNLELQKEKSLATNISLEVSSILSANMSSSEKDALKAIYDTSGFDTLKNKLFLLLENHIAISEAEISHRQGVYGIITEILLVLFTLVSIYEPIKNLFNSTLTITDVVISIILFTVLIICSILIIRKEK